MKGIYQCSLMPRFDESRQSIAPVSIAAPYASASPATAHTRSLMVQNNVQTSPRSKRYEIQIPKSPVDGMLRAATASR